MLGGEVPRTKKAPGRCRASGLSRTRLVSRDGDETQINESPFCRSLSARTGDSRIPKSGKARAKPPCFLEGRDHEAGGDRNESQQTPYGDELGFERSTSFTSEQLIEALGELDSHKNAETHRHH